MSNNARHWLVGSMLLGLAGTGLAQEAASPKGVVELEEHRKPALQVKGDCFIRGGTLLTVSRGVIRDGSILVQGGKIARIGRDLTPPAGVPVIEAQGKFITPGIIDAHSHIASDAINEGTDSITADVRIHDVLDPDDRAIYRALGGGVTAALILHGSANTIGGQSAVVKMKWRHPVEEILVPDAPRIIKFALGENVKRSNSVRTDGTPGRFPSTRMGVEAVLRRGFDEARRYRAAWERHDREADADTVPPRRDLRLETLADILAGKIWVHCHAYRADEMLMMLRVAKDYGFKLAAFQHALEAYKIAPEIRDAGVGVSTFADYWAYKVEAWDAIPYTPALCRQAGIVTSVNSDDPERIRRLNHDAAKSIKYGGLSPEEALKLITLYPAQQLGIAHRTGTLDEGKDADLAIWDGHPLSVYSRCAMTFVEGELLFQRRDAFGMDRTAAIKHDLQACRADHMTLPTPASGRVYAITGGTVHPVSGPEIPNGTVVVVDGRIQAVGARVEIPRGAVRVDARGLHVYPGLIDAGSELGLREISSVRATVDTEEGAGLHPDLRALTAVNAASEHFAVTRFNGITSALSRPSGSLGGQSVMLNLSGWTGEEMALKDRTALHLRFPRPLSERVRSLLPAEEVARRQAEGSSRERRLREFFEAARDYAARRQAAGDRVTPDPRMEAMIPYITGKAPVVFHADDVRTIKAVVAFAGDFKLKAILAGGLSAWRVADLLKEKDIPVLYGPVHNLPQQDFDPYDAPMAGAALLQRAGVKVAFQSDSAATARDLPHHAGMAAAYGLPHGVTLRALTLGAAEILGVADQVGSLEAGKLGNVIVTDGDPLEPSTSLHYLFIAGKPVALESKHSQLYRTYRQRLPSGSSGRE